MSDCTTGGCGHCSDCVSVGMDVRVREKRAKDDAMWAEYHSKRRRCGGCNNDFLKTQFRQEATVCPGCQDAGVVSINTWKARREGKE